LPPTFSNFLLRTTSARSNPCSFAGGFLREGLVFLKKLNMISLGEFPLVTLRRSDRSPQGEHQVLGHLINEFDMVPQIP